jgi:uncharacterized heparinase superfamily protein
LRGHSNSWTEPIFKNQSQLAANRFRFLNATHEVNLSSDWNNAVHDKQWLYNLHYFDDLNGQDAPERREWHAALIERWIAENLPASGNGWESYPLSLRIVNWIKWVLSGNDLSNSARHSLAVQVRYLSKRLERHLLGNHLLANAKALIFAGLFFGGAEAEGWLSQGHAVLSAELKEQLLPDGGHFERSPMYHAIVLEDLFDIINFCSAYEGTAIEKFKPGGLSLQDCVARMLDWMRCLCHPDGDIVLFNDGAFRIAAHPSALEDYAQRLGFTGTIKPLSVINHLTDTGYIRIQKEPCSLFLDVAPIGPDYQPGHAHADTLSFEMSMNNQRVIIDSGTSTYLAGPERLRQRSTAAHNTVEIDGQDSSEVWESFRVARRARPFDIIVSEKADGISVTCSHDGYKRLSGKPIHRRKWLLKPLSLHVRDRISGRFRRAVGRFHFNPDIEVKADNSFKTGLLGLRSGRYLKWEVFKGRATINDSTYHPEFGLTIPNKCLEVAFTSPETDVVFSWK